METALIGLILYVVGVLSRTGYGFLAKIVEAPDGSPVKFDAKYLATCVMSLIASFFMGLLTFQTNVALPLGDNLTLLILATLPTGYMMNDIVNRGVNIVQTSGQKKVP